MSGNTASSKDNGGTEPTGPPTGYRVSVVPGALEISARLGTPEEVRNLMKVLRAGLTILYDTTDGDMDEPSSAPLSLKPWRQAATEKPEGRRVALGSGSSSRAPGLQRGQAVSSLACRC